MAQSEIAARVAALEAELTTLKGELARLEAGEPASRRDVFKKLAVAGAGVVAGAAVVGTQSAGAVSGSPLVIGQLNSAANITYLGNGTFANQPGTALTTEKTLFWCDNRDSTLNNAYGVRGDGHGTDGVGVHGNSDFSGIGVLGSSGSGIGVSALAAIGVQANGTRAAVQLVPNGPAPATRTDAHVKGELVYDTDGNLWFCVVDGSPGTWRQLTGPTVTGQLHLLPGPVRVYDSRPGGTNDGPLSAGASRTVSLATGKSAGSTVPAVPPGASGALISLTVDATTGAGFLAVFANGIPYPGNSNVNWYTNGQIAAVTTVTVVDATSKVVVLAGGVGGTQFVIDVIGYYG